MLQPDRINRFEDFIVYNNFDLIYQICKQIRGCHYYYISKEDGIIYACNELLYALHAVDIPSNLMEDIVIPKSMPMELAFVNEAFAMQYSTFMMYKEYPWILLPTETRHEHMNYRIYFDYNTGSTTIMNGDNTVDFISLYDPSRIVFNIQKLMDMVTDKHRAEYWLGESQFFGDQEKNPVIRMVMDNKASAIGNKYLRLTSINGKNYGMMVFKNLFNLNKADSLVICIRDRNDMANTFQAAFITTKKKSPIPTIIPFYKETTYATFLNL